MPLAHREAMYPRSGQRERLVGGLKTLVDPFVPHGSANGLVLIAPNHQNMKVEDSELQLETDLRLAESPPGGLSLRVPLRSSPELAYASLQLQAQSLRVPLRYQRQGRAGGDPLGDPAAAGDRVRPLSCTRCPGELRRRAVRLASRAESTAKKH
jgi:hypothetical protein